MPRCVKTYWAGGRLAVVVSALWFRGSGSHVESVNPGRNYFLGKDAFVKFCVFVSGGGGPGSIWDELCGLKQKSKFEASNLGRFLEA